jgi:hypothetical protein
MLVNDSVFIGSVQHCVHCPEMYKKRCFNKPYFKDNS